MSWLINVASTTQRVGRTCAETHGGLEPPGSFCSAAHPPSWESQAGALLSPAMPPEIDTFELASAAWRRSSARRRGGAATSTANLEPVRDPLRISDAFRIRAQIIRTDRHLAVPVRDVQHVGRLGDAGKAAAQGAHQRLPLGDRHLEVAGAGRRIELVQIVGF